jgi:hypothetical protein
MMELEEDGITPAQLREEAKLLNEMADGIGLTSKQRKAARKKAKELKQRARELETPPPKRWMVVFGDERSETGFVESPQHPGQPGWTYDREEAEQLCPPGGRVVDADAFAKAFNERLPRG